MRTDQLILFNTGIPVSQALSIVLAIVSAVLIIRNRIKFKGNPSVWGDDKKNEEEKN